MLSVKDGYLSSGIDVVVWLKWYLLLLLVCKNNMNILAVNCQSLWENRAKFE